MLNLYLLRHAKSSWSRFLVPDINRPLNGRGRRAARVMADHMAEMKISPDLVLCSPARRTRQTLEVLSKRLPEGAQTLFESGLYGSGADGYLEVIKEHGGSAQTILLIGHNPAMEELAALLVGGGDEAAQADMDEKFPTAALAHIAFETAAWSDLAPGSGHLVSFIKPREL